ncbi:MAG: hypothetical protein HFH91_00490 [Lachnospiraceae bacterium]|nr:hypothetical protein [Lachnospiraceae bacterium]
MENAGKGNGRVIIQLLVLGILLLAVPVMIGGLFSRADRGCEGILFRWISGQFLLWAGFQMICVPLILKESRFGSVANLFLGYMLACMLLAAGAGVRRRAKSAESRFAFWKRGRIEKRREGLLLWAVFFALLFFQLIQAVRLSYADTDDAFYVAVSSVTESADTMYQILPYTGLATGLDIRHGLAPFPIWIAFLAKMSGMQAVMVAKLILPVVLISMAYAIFYLLGGLLFPEKGGRQALFLIFTELLVLFGNYSIYTAENFLIARSRQGKAALGSIVIPFLLYLLLLLMKRLQEGWKISPALYLLLGAGAATGCLCSTLGALLICLMIGIAGLLGAVFYKGFRELVLLAVCCLPCVCFAALYFFY